MSVKKYYSFLICILAFDAVMESGMECPGFSKDRDEAYLEGMYVFSCTPLKDEKDFDALKKYAIKYQKKPAQSLRAAYSIVMHCLNNAIYCNKNLDGCGKFLKLLLSKDFGKELFPIYRFVDECKRCGIDITKCDEEKLWVAFVKFMKGDKNWESELGTESIKRKDKVSSSFGSRGVKRSTSDGGDSSSIKMKDKSHRISGNGLENMAI